jgi:hypothetical protein
MTAPVGKPSATDAPRKAVSDYDSRDRLGEIFQRDGVFEARGRRGQVIGSYDSADAAIEAVRVAAGLDVP